MTQANRDRVRDAFKQADPSHPGLWLDRGLAARDKGHVQELLERVAASTPSEIYQRAYRRWEAALRGRPNAALAQMNVTGSLIVGLGSASVLEAGITLQRTYGMPLIPGPALKGLARHYAEQVLATQAGAPLAAELAKGQQYHAILFGEQKSAGYVTYYDAWYVPGPAGGDRPFARDVITVHHPHYYTGTPGQRTAPSDFDDPNPIPFISARGQFLIAVEAPDPAWSRFALEILQRALADYGAGGKTSSGYGRFTVPAASTAVAGDAGTMAAQQEAAVPAPVTPSSEPPRYKRKQSVEATVVSINKQRLTVRLHTQAQEQLPVEISVVLSMTEPGLLQQGATIKVRIEEFDRKSGRILKISKTS